MLQMGDGVRNGLLSSGVVAHCTVRSRVAGVVHPLNQLNLALRKYTDATQHLTFGCIPLQQQHCKVQCAWLKMIKDIGGIHPLLLSLSVPEYIPGNKWLLIVYVAIVQFMESVSLYLEEECTISTCHWKEPPSLVQGGSTDQWVNRHLDVAPERKHPTSTDNTVRHSRHATVYLTHSRFHSLFSLSFLWNIRDDKL